METKTAEIVKKLLADHIGVDLEDINEEDLFLDDLHMNAADLTDFLQLLEDKGFDVSQVDLSEITTVRGLLELMTSS